MISNFFTFQKDYTKFAKIANAVSREKVNSQKIYKKSYL